MYRIAILVAVFARVCLGATPGKLVEPGVVEVTLKDGEPYNITCPPIFKKNVGDFFQPDDYKGMVAACLNGRFSIRCCFWLPMHIICNKRHALSHRKRVAAFLPSSNSCTIFILQLISIPLKDVTDALLHLSLLHSKNPDFLAMTRNVSREERSKMFHLLSFLK